MQTSSAMRAPGLRAALITYAVALQDWIAPSAWKKQFNKHSCSSFKSCFIRRKVTIMYPLCNMLNLFESLGIFVCTFVAQSYLVFHKHKVIRTVCWPKQWHVADLLELVLLMQKVTVMIMLVMALLLQQLSPVSQPQTWMVRVPVELREGGPLSTTRIGRKYTFCSWRLKPDRWVRMPAVLSGWAGFGGWESDRKTRWSRELHMKDLIYQEENLFVCSLMSFFYQAALKLMKLHPLSDFITLLVLFLLWTERTDRRGRTIWYYCPTCKALTSWQCNMFSIWLKNNNENIVFKKDEEPSEKHHPRNLPCSAVTGVRTAKLNLELNDFIWKVDKIYSFFFQGRRELLFKMKLKM